MLKCLVGLETLQMIRPFGLSADDVHDRLYEFGACLRISLALVPFSEYAEHGPSV